MTVPSSPSSPVRRRLVASALLGAGVSRAPASRSAPKFPVRPVRLVVPYSAGIGPDVVARAVAVQLARHWGQPVTVENKPGASGIVAFGEVRHTPPDGHTIFLADTATLAVNPLLHKNLPYDPVKDLEPITLLFRATFMLMTGVPGRYPDLRSLLAVAGGGPDRVRYGTLGNGHPSQMAVEVMARQAGVQMMPVPFRDGGALFTAVALGEVDFTAISMNTVSGLAAAGRLRPLAVGALARLPAHPQVPTIGEAGGPPVEMRPWAALVTVAGTPAPVLEQLQRDLTRAISAREVREMADTAGFELMPSTPQALRDRAATDLALYEPLVREGRVARL